MGLDKAIQHGKEKRKPYYGSKAHDASCRNHGSCPYCYGNRTIARQIADQRRIDAYTSLNSSEQRLSRMLGD